MSHGQIRHIEIAGRTGPELEAFYAKLFGWGINARDMAGYRYADVTAPSTRPGMGIRHEPDGHPEVVIYVEVDDLEEAVREAEILGAEIRIPPMEYGAQRFALINDPEGNPVGLLAPDD
ncbi:MAG: VOC family protein [Pseudomonadota bacterium]